MHEIWGKIPLSEIFAPALEWSKEGINVDKFQAYDFTLLKDIFSLNPIGKKIYFDSNDRLKEEGHKLKMAEELLFQSACSNALKSFQFNEFKHVQRKVLLSLALKSEGFQTQALVRFDKLRQSLLHGGAALDEFGAGL